MSDLYSDIGEVESSFLSRESVKEVINRPIELLVLELEYVKQSAKDVPHISPTDPGVLTEIDLILGRLVPPVRKKKTIKSGKKTVISKKTNKKNKSNRSSVSNLTKPIKK